MELSSAVTSSWLKPRLTWRRRYNGSESIDGDAAAVAAARDEIDALSGGCAPACDIVGVAGKGGVMMCVKRAWIESGFSVLGLGYASFR